MKVFRTSFTSSFRKRHTCKDRDVLLATATGEQRQQIKFCPLGENCDHFRQIVQDNYTTSIVWWWSSCRARWKCLRNKWDSRYKSRNISWVSVWLGLSTETNGSAILPAPLLSNGEQVKNGQTSLSDRRRIFKQIIVKCVLQLLLIETTNDLLRNDEVYREIPPEQLLRLMGVLDHSYQFARMFNEDKELRTGLWKVGMCIHYRRYSFWYRQIRFYETPAEFVETGIQ